MNCSPKNNVAVFSLFTPRPITDEGTSPAPTETGIGLFKVIIY